MNTPPLPLDSGHRGTDDDQQQPESLAFYSTPAHEDLLHQVRALVDGSHAIALLVGPRGIGKTSLIYRLQNNPPDNWRLCRLNCDSMMHPDQLLKRLGRCVDVHLSGDDMAEALGQALAKLRQLGQIPVIVLDDAELLPISSLITLMRLHEQQMDSAPVCALILFAQAMIDRTLATHQLHAMGTNQLVRFEIPALSREQTTDYVRHFLRDEGVESYLELDDQQLTGIHRDSGGLPGKVNDLVIRALRKPGFNTQIPLIDRLRRKIRVIPPMTATASAVLLALLLLITLFQDQIDRLFGQQEPAQPELADTLAPMEPTGAGDRLGDAQPEHGTSMSQPLPLPLPLPPQAKPSETPEPYQPEPSPEHPKSTATPDPRPEIPASRPAADKRPPEPVRAPREEPIPEIPPPATTSPRPKTAAWLLKQNPDAYSLQILAAGSEAAVRRFLQQHALGREVYYFESRRKGQPWFAVLHGIYKDRDTAVAALKKLPEPLGKAGAWPRALSSIQSEIKKAR